MNDPHGLRRRRRRGRRRRTRGRRCSTATCGTSSIAHVPGRLHRRRLHRRRRATPGAGCAGGATATTARRSSCRSRSPRWPRPVQVVVGDWARAHGGRATSRSSSPRSRAWRRRRRARPFTSAAATTSDERGRATGIEIPKLLSLLAYHDPNATVPGLDAVPPERPPAGQHRALRVPDDGRRSARCWRCSAWSSCRRGRRRRRLPRSPWFYRAVVAAGPLSFVALIAGWITTEVGRQPWIVYEVMRTEEAVTAASGHRGRLRGAGRRLRRA